MNIIPTFVRRRISHRGNLLKILDNLGWLFFDKLLRMGLGFIIVVWLARHLGSEQFGLFSLISTFVSMFYAVAGLGLQSIVVRDLARDPSCKEEILGTAAVLQFFGGIFSYGCLLAVICWLRPEDTLAKLLVSILGAMILFKFSEVSQYWFESQVLSKYIVWVQNGCFLFFAPIKIALIFYGSPLITFAWIVTAEAFTGGILILVILGFRGPKFHQLRFSVCRAKTLLVDCWPLLLSGIAIIIYMKIDQVMLGQILGDASVGIYSAAVRVSEIFYFIPMMIGASFFPSILEAQTRNEVEYHHRLQCLYDLMIILSILVALPMTFLSTTIVVMLFGSNFVDAGPVLAIHTWASVFVFLGVASSQWFLAENLQMLSFQRTMLGAVVNVILNFVLIPLYGPIGAAIATVISYSVAVFFVDFFQKETKHMFSMKVRSMNIISSIKRLK